MRVVTGLSAVVLLGVSGGLAAAEVPEPQSGDAVLKDFEFASGETLPEVKIHYRTLGRPARGPSIEAGSRAGIYVTEILLVVQGRVAGVVFPEPAQALPQHSLGALLHLRVLPETIQPSGVVVHAQLSLVLPGPVRDVLQLGGDLLLHLFPGHDRTPQRRANSNPC